MTDINIDKYFKINRTLIQKLVDTGYDVTNEEIEVSKNKDLFKSLYNNLSKLNDFHISSISSLSEGMRIFKKKYNKFYKDENDEFVEKELERNTVVYHFQSQVDGITNKLKSISKDSIKSFYEKISNSEIGSLNGVKDDSKEIVFYLVLENKLSPDAASTIKNIKDVARHVIYYEDELLFNPTKNLLVPKHVLLTEKEKYFWFADKNLTPDMMPRILLSDPQIKYLDALIGDVVKVVNPSPTVDQFTRHLIVVGK